MTMKENHDIAQCLTLRDIFQEAIPFFHKDSHVSDAPVLRKHRELRVVSQDFDISVPTAIQPENIYLQTINWDASSTQFYNLTSSS